MGLFVAGRLGRRHDMTVRLLSGGNGVGTTAQLYLPPELLDGGSAGPAYGQERLAVSATPEAPEPIGQQYPRVVEFVPAEPDSDVASVTPLPRRDPGSSGIAGAAVEQPFDEPGAPQAPAEPWLTHTDEAAKPTSAAPKPSDTSGFFSSRGRLRTDDVQPEPAPAPTAEQADSSMVIHYEADPETAAVQSVSDEKVDSDDLIYQNMVSEWLVNPNELAVSQDWKSVWDNGWAAAEDAENKPVNAHTDHGLPVREPGARLVPGGAADLRDGCDTNDADQENAVASGARDPDAIRASISNHFGGVHAARTHARDTTQGLDHQ